MRRASSTSLLTPSFSIRLARWTCTVFGALADTIGFSPLFAVLAVFDLLGALVIWNVLQNKPAIEVAQESHNDPAPQH